MIRYLLDSSALWRILREPSVAATWREAITGGAVGSCPVQRAEFRRSARSRDEYDEVSEMFADLYPDVGAPKSMWPWMESAQYRLVRSGAHRGPSPVDLAVAATAAVQGLVVLHDDGDIETMGRYLDDLDERRVEGSR